MLNWFYFLLLIVLSGLCFFAGYRYVSPARAGWRRPLTWLSIAGIFSFALLHWRPDWEFNYLPEWLSLFVEIVNFVPLALFYFGVSVGEVRREPGLKMKHKHLPVGLAILGGLIFVYGLQRNSWLFAAPEVDRKKFTLVDNNKICLQSTGYTCGPASAVTLLKYWEIVATESEMAALTRTRRFSGVTIDGLARGILRKIQITDLNHPPSLKVRLIHPGWNDLVKLDVPFIVSTKLYFMVDHVVVVLKVFEDKVLIADPLSGKTIWPKQEFLERWRGEIIVISNR